VKKKYRLILVSFILAINLFGCDLDKTQQPNNKILTYEEVDNFAMKNKIKRLNTEKKDNGYIITYEKETKYGIMKLYRDESSDEIRYIEESVDNSNHPDDIVYMQISDSKENYIALFINNEDLRKRAEDITVEFEDKGYTNEPYMISQTTNKQKATVISYENYGSKREIKSIILRDKNNNDIYTQ
jgi:hypothetical protein